MCHKLNTVTTLDCAQRYILENHADGRSTQSLIRWCAIAHVGGMKKSRSPFAVKPPPVHGVMLCQHTVGIMYQSRTSSGSASWPQLLSRSEHAGSLPSRSASTAPTAGVHVGG